MHFANKDFMDWKNAKREQQYRSMRASYPIYIKVPFPERFDAARRGAKFDALRKCWYIPVGERPAKFQWPQIIRPPKKRL